MTRTIYSESDFYPAFMDDIKQASFMVLLQSPFLSKRRIDKLETLIKTCVSRRVRLCIFVQRSREAAKQSEIETLADRLRACGAHVSFRKLIHAKIAIIDDQILWDGSLNILSQTVSYERMTRTLDRELVLDAVRRHAIDNCDICFADPARTLLTYASKHEQVLALGRKLAIHRKKFGLTQDELARQVGVHQSIISLIERGSLNVKLDKLLRVCGALNLELMPIPWHVVPMIDGALSIQ